MSHDGPPIEEALDRLVRFEACFNFRDLGGYPTKDTRSVRPGRLFRSDTLHRLTVTDIDAFLRLGLRTVIDLRSRPEIDDFGRLHDDLHGRLSWHHLPMLDRVVLRPAEPEGGEERRPSPARAADPFSRYLRMVTNGAAARAVALLAEPDGQPAVFHCTSGKDRTGVVAAMVLDLLGVDDEVIVADYLLTERARERSSAWIEENEPRLAAYFAQLPAGATQMRPDPIVGLLAGLRDQHGSVEAFLRSSGVTAQQIRALRGSVLEG